MQIESRAARVIEQIHAARTFGEKNGLNNMTALLAELGHPQRMLRFVHVAGTNGKGSTCAMMESALRACGLRTGLYTSPFLCRYHERIRVNGVPISDAALADVGERVLAAAQALNARGVRPTTFELGTALALSYFARERVDLCVIEVGLGGRLDPTNVIAPDACVITAIGMDHMGVLGDTPEKIAFEKAGIIKPGVPVALYPQTPQVDAVFESVCAQRGSALQHAGALPLNVSRLDAWGARIACTLPHLGRVETDVPLCGRHQVDNARLALAGLDLLAARGWALDAPSVARGVSRTCWPGRLEWLDAHLLIDGAHNPHGARALRGYVQTYLQGRRVVLLTATMRDKQPQACAALFSSCAVQAITTQVDWPRALPADDLAAIYRALGRSAEPIPDIPAAFNRARVLAGSEGVVLACGSLYLVGALRSLVLPQADSPT